MRAKEAFTGRERAVSPKKKERKAMSGSVTVTGCHSKQKRTKAAAKAG